eukprot:11126247-Ditylum_brightwellii.AAC.1
MNTLFSFIFSSVTSEARFHIVLSLVFLFKLGQYTTKSLRRGLCMPSGRHTFVGVACCHLGAESQQSRP